MIRRLAMAAGGVGLLLLLLAAAAWFGPDVLRGRAERAATRALGHPVTVASLHLLPVWPPTAVADGVVVRDVGDVRQARATLEGAALWRGQARLASVVLLHPALRIETDASGLRAPLLPRRKRPSPAVAPAVERRPGETGHWQARVEDARIVWHDPRLGSDVVVHASGQVAAAGYDLSLTADPAGPVAAAGLTALAASVRGGQGEGWHVGVTGDFRGEAFSAAADIPAPAGWSAPASMPVAATLDLAGAMLTARGSLRDPVAPTAFEGHVSAQAGDTARLAALLGAAALPAGGLAFDGDVVADRGHVALRHVALDTQMLAGTGEASWQAGTPPTVAARLDLRRLDLDGLSRAWRARAAIASPVPAATPQRSSPPAVSAPVVSDARAIPEAALPWAALDRLDAELELHAARLDLHGAAYQDAVASVSLHDGTLVAQPVAATLPPDSRLDGSLRLASRAGSESGLVLHAPALEIGPLLRALDLPPVLDGPAAIDADLHATGATPRALAASLDGHATLHMAGGAIDARLLDAVLGAAHLPAPRLSGQVKLRCLDLALQARHGVVSVGSLAADTEALRVDGGGTVDLGREAVDLMLFPLLRIGPGLTVPVHLGGTLRQPTVQVGAGGPAPPPGAGCPEPVGEHAKPPKLLDLFRRLP